MTRETRGFVGAAAVSWPAAAPVDGSEDEDEEVFDLELEDGLPREAVHELPLLNLARALHALERALNPCERQLLRDAAAAKAAAATAGGALDLQAFARGLRAAGYECVVRVGGATGRRRSVLSELRHSFVVVKHLLPGTEETFVEPCFREQFALPDAVATPAYRAFLSQLPPLAVGGRGALLALVCAAAGAVSDTFSFRGLDVPPWRTPCALASLWLPARHSDEPVVGGAAKAATWPVAGAGSPASVLDSSSALLYGA